MNWLFLVFIFVVELILKNTFTYSIVDAVNFFKLSNYMANGGRIGNIIK